MSDNPTTALPTFLGREHRHTGPVPLDYERGEFWIHGVSHDGARRTAPHMRQRDDEGLNAFIARVVDVEARIDGWNFPEAVSDVQSDPSPRVRQESEP